MPRTKKEVIGIAENDLCAEFFQRFIAQALYRCLRAHRHEYRRFVRSVRGGRPSAARSACISFENFEREVHSLSVSGENPRESHLDRHIDRPSLDDAGWPLAS